MRFTLARYLSGLLAWLLVCLPAAAEHLTLFHTGNTGGLASSYRYDLQDPYLLASSFVQTGEAYQAFSVSGDAIPFYADRHYLWGTGFGIDQLQAFLARAPEPESRSEVVLLQSRDSLMADASAGQVLMGKVEAWLRRQPGLREQYRLREAELLRYPGPVYQLRFKDAPALPRELQSWELLIGFELGFRKGEQSDPMMVIGQPQGEGSRRMRLIRQLRGPEDLLLDSGNLLEGRTSVVHERLSQRENSLRMAQALNYFAINVGPNELSGGLDNLRQEQEAYALPLISATLRQNKHYLFTPYKIIQAGQLRMALIGIGDSTAFENQRQAGQLPADTEILAPAEALTQALLRLRAQEPVDLVAVLSHLEAPELQKLAGLEVNLLLANPDQALQHTRASLMIDNYRQSHSFSVNGPPQGLAMTRIESRGEGLALSSELLPIPFSLPPQAEALAQILAIRHSEYADALTPLLPDPAALIREDPELLRLFLDSRAPREAARRLKGLQPLESEQLLGLYPPYLTSELLAHLELNSLLELFTAEVAVFRINQGLDLNVPGALRRKLIYENIPNSEVLERYYLNGAQLKKLLALKLPGLIFGGANLTKNQIWGREIGDSRTIYQVLIPTSLARLAPLRSLLSGVRSDTRLSNPLVPGSVPERLMLRPLLIGLLERLRDHRDANQEIRRLMKPLWNERRLLFSIQLDSFQLNLSGYNALNNSAYAQVRETRVTSPSSLTFGGRTRLALGLDNALLGLTTALAAKYEGLAVLDKADSFSENQDDLLLSSELKLNLWEFSLFETKLLLTPFLEGFYDTEFTPTLNKQTRLLNPLQSELRGVLGLMIPPGERLKTFKAGLALRRDFNVPNNFEAGLDLKLAHNLPLTPSLSWNNDFSLRYFLPAANDNLSSLGLIGQWLSALELTLTDNLTLRFYADSYVFQGKRPETSQLGASVILGIGLGFDRIWKPWFEPVF